MPILPYRFGKDNSGATPRTSFLKTREDGFLVKKNMKTAEYVTYAHPDKVCDQISDAILDACLAQDPTSRCAMETAGGHGVINLIGELTTKAELDMAKIALDVYRECGYDDDVDVHMYVSKQSPEIGAGVDQDGAGDQGIMVGFATHETPEYLPKEVVLARKLTDMMGAHDGKSQVTLNTEGYIENFITSLSRNGKDYDIKLYENIEELRPYFENNNIKERWFNNPNGEWTVSGFTADAGVTGRKLAVDNYGPNVPVGGGAFSGKDSTNVDRSAAYMARKIAVDYINKTGAKEALVKIAYSIGVSQPTMATVTIDGTTEKIVGYDLRPSAIIEFLELRKPQFRDLARRGHFGRDRVWDKPTKA